MKIERIEIHVTALAARVQRIFSSGSYDIFYTRPIPLILLLISAITILTPIVKAILQQRKNAHQ